MNIKVIPYEIEINAEILLNINKILNYQELNIIQTEMEDAL